MALRASWGIKSDHRNTPANVSGVVTDYDTSLEPIMAALQDEVGADIGHTVYDEKTSVSVTIQCKSTAQLPPVNAPLTINGVTFYVDHTNITESNQAYMKFTASLSKFKATPEIEVAS